MGFGVKNNFGHFPPQLQSLESPNVKGYSRPFFLIQLTFKETPASLFLSEIGIFYNLGLGAKGKVGEKKTQKKGFLLSDWASVSKIQKSDH